ncbi:MAG: LysR family transcriptional regulator [Myxococcota bacterium]
MDFTQLRYFLAVAEHGSISAAARAVEARQPTLSVAIKNLEEDLGATLFHRDSRGVSLTASGRVLRDAAQEIFEGLERVRQQVSGLETEDVGEFVIGCNEALGTYFLPEFMPGFLRAAPQIQLRLWNGTSAAVRNAVLDRKVDFGISVNPEPHDDLVMVKLYRDGIELFVSSKEPPVKNRIQALIRVRKGPLIAASRVAQVRDLIARFQSDEVMPDRILDCGDLQLVKSLAVAGLGVALLPRRVAGNGDPAALRRLHPELPGFPDTIYLLYRADLHRTQAALKLKDALVEYGRTLQASDPNDDSILPP